MSKSGKPHSAIVKPTATRADVVLHPVRFRILTLVTGRKLSPQQISAGLPDVPLASIYRHINKLSEAGVLQCMDESSSRGSSERHYTIPTPGAVTLSAEETAKVSLADNLNSFTSFCTLLMSKGSGFIRRKAAEGATGGTYSLEALYLSDSEYEHLLAAIQGLEGLALSNKPGPGRRRRLMFNVILPDDQDGD